MRLIHFKFWTKTQTLGDRFSYRWVLKPCSICFSHISSRHVWKPSTEMIPRQFSEENLHLVQTSSRKRDTKEVWNPQICWFQQLGASPIGNQKSARLRICRATHFRRGFRQCFYFILCGPITHDPNHSSSSKCEKRLGGQISIGDSEYVSRYLQKCSDQKWAPASQTKPFLLIKRPKPARVENLATWFSMDDEKIEKKVQTIHKPWCKKGFFAVFSYFVFLWGPK